MKILVFGKHGQVATELRRRCPASDDAVFLGREDVDFLKPQNLALAIQHHKPDAVINAAAWTDVDAAESHEADATIVNADAPDMMARECAQSRIPFLHISTDYVFDGEGHDPYKPSDPTDPQTAYGRSKWLGENKISASGSHHVILRTSWVFSSLGKNFVKTMLRLGQERTSLNVVHDQIGGPTPASAIADALLHVAKAMRDGKPGGIYHFSGYPDVSWSDFARHIMASAHLACSIRDIASSDYPTPARRPKNSRLDCSGLERDFGLHRPDWRIALTTVLGELGVSK